MDKDTVTTSTTAATPLLLTIDDIMQVIADIKTQTRDSPWILISPTGVVYTGKPEYLITHLAPYHPLMTVRTGL